MAKDHAGLTQDAIDLMNGNHYLENMNSVGALRSLLKKPLHKTILGESGTELLQMCHYLYRFPEYRHYLA
jgi:hypothetical protein